MAALALLSVLETRRLTGELAALRRQLRNQQQQRAALESTREIYQQTLAILSDPQTKEFRLEPTHLSQPALHIYWNDHLGLVLAGERMSGVAPARTFQLWIEPQKGQPISVGIFRPDAAGEVLLVSPPRAARGAAAGLSVTEEPAGGSPQPTAKPSWSGRPR